MSWCIEDHPDGGLQIKHETSPRFTARWTSGAFPIDQVRDGAFFWTDEGGGPEDSIHLYDFAWRDPAPTDAPFNQLMREAIEVIEEHILSD